MGNIVVYILHFFIDFFPFTTLKYQTPQNSRIADKISATESVRYLFKVTLQ